MKKLLGELWDITADFEDYLKYGARRGNRPEYVPDSAEVSLSGAHQSGLPLKEGYSSGSAVNGDDSLERIAAEVSECGKCQLCRKRVKVVPGDGPVKPLVMVVGEGPGAEEDASGLPFVGAAGKYLDKWLEAVSLDRKTNCFIGNIVKCRPPGNRDPLPDEIEACRPYLERQVALLKPKAILAVGRISSRVLTGKDEGIGRLRGGNYSYKGIPVVVTYHPSAVLRDRSYRPAVWEDLKKLRDILDKI